MFFRKQKIAVNDNRIEPVDTGTGSGASFVAAGMSVTGNIDCEGDLIVEGTVRGSVRAQKLTIGRDGQIEGPVAADDVLVRGTVKGQISARHVHLEAESTVEGDLTTTTIAIDTGARLTGAVWQQAEGQEPSLPFNPPASSWEQRNEDPFRPLSSVRPRLGGNTR